jgi:hypothetical protein
MGYLDENTVVLIKNLYTLVGLWLALRFLLYIVRERPRNPYAAIGMIIVGYSAVITYSYGSSAELGEPKFYLDWLITVPLIFLSFILVDYDRTKEQTAFQFALTTAATAVFFLIYLLLEGDQGKYDEAFAVMTGIFGIGMIVALISIADRNETYPLSNPTVPILILLFAYPFLYFYSTSEPWTGFEREFFEGSYLEDLGLNWFDLIGILFLLSFICKFWLSWYHVVSNDDGFTLIGDLSVQQDGEWTDGTDVATTLFLGAGVIASVANWLRLYAGENQALLLSLLLIVLAIVFFFSRIYVVRSAK